MAEHGNRENCVFEGQGEDFQPNDVQAIHEADSGPPVSHPRLC